MMYLISPVNISKLRRRPLEGGGRNRIGRREKWPKSSWEEGEIGGKSREEGEKEKLILREEGEIGSKSREEGEIGSESREKGDLPPVPPPSIITQSHSRSFNFQYQNANGPFLLELYTSI